MNPEYHLYVTLPFYLLFSIGLFGCFKKAEEDGWKAFVPFLNVWVWLKIAGRPKWWLALFFIPVLNFIMGISLLLDLAKSFGKERFIDQFLIVIFPFFYLPYLGFNKSDRYEGAWGEIGKNMKRKKGELREWADAILFAGTAALIIRTFMLEAFMIPTTSMEGSLLAGDFLFVSKFHYGVRMPMVPVAFPFVHNTFPGTEVKSYSSWPRLPYHRLPGLMDVERNDIVVFNYPFNDAQPDNNQHFTVEIPSMKQNYIKRCVAIPGDTLSIKNGQVFIDGKKGWNPDHLQFDWHVIAESGGLSRQFMKRRGYRVDPGNQNSNFIPLIERGFPESHRFHYKISATKEEAKDLERLPYVRKVKSLMQKPNKKNKNVLNEVESPVYPGFPDKSLNNWNLDNFGPLWIPARGATIKLNMKNLPYYSRCIEAYEHHELEVKNKKIFIDGKETDSYTFEMDYYFMMGDNRHASLDSRYWGFVPEDHIVGRPWFVLISFEDGIRTDRILNPVTTWED